MDIKGLGFSKEEIREITISTLILAFIFYYPGFSAFFSELGIVGFLKYMFFFIILGLAFIPHELAHKFMAMKYGCFAQYQMWMGGLKFALLMVFMTNGSFAFAAPGAVVIYTSFRDHLGVRHVTITKKQNAYISMAGPLTNFAMAALMIPFMAIPGISSLAGSIYYVNVFLGLFNMIPFGPLDGTKVFVWDKVYWGAIIALGLMMMFVL